VIRYIGEESRVMRGNGDKRKKRKKMKNGKARRGLYFLFKMSFLKKFLNFSQTIKIVKN